MLMVLLFNKWLLGLLLLGNPVHPYHVSATEMEYDAKTQRIEISTKIFTDDFENALNRLYRQKTDFSDAALKQQMTALVSRYIASHLVLKVEGKAVPIRLYGWEVDREAVYVYTIAEVSSRNPKHFTVENKVLYDLFSDQVNIIHFIYNGNRKSTKLEYPSTKAELSF